MSICHATTVVTAGQNNAQRSFAAIAARAVVIRVGIKPDEIRRFLETLRPSGLQNLIAISLDGQLEGATFEMPSELDQAVHWAEEHNAAGRNIYFSVNPVSRRIATKARKADIAKVEYVHLDVDPRMEQGYKAGREQLQAKTLPALRAFSSPPTLIVDSGNGSAAYWRLEDSTIGDAELINQQLIQCFDGDSGTHNIDRIMRVPGTRNYTTEKKLARGYPSGHTVAQLLGVNADARYDVATLAKALPELARRPLNDRHSQPFDEDQTPLTEEEIARLDERLSTSLQHSPSLERRWRGDSSGLQDSSRSGLDFSVTARLKGLGYAYRETAFLVSERFQYGKGHENTARDLQRNWSRTGSIAVVDLVAQCVEAKERGDDWAPGLFSAQPSRESLDTVLCRLAEKPEFSGKRTLKQHYDAYAAQKAAEASEQAFAERSANRSELEWNPTARNLMVREIERALRDYPGSWEVLRYGGVHCLITFKAPSHLHAIDQPGAEPPKIPIFQLYTKYAMQLRIEQSVAFFQVKDGCKELIPVPDSLANLVLENPQPNIPVTTGLVTHPLVLPGGNLLDTQGLHQETGIYLDFGGIAFDGLGSMTPQEGVAILRQEMLGEFQFRDEVDVAAALAFILTSIERKVMDMAPGFMINASTQGSGKTTLARMVHLLITGYDMPVATLSDNPEEQEKALTAQLAASVPMICWDNISDGFTIRSPVLARTLTSPTHTGRILGYSKMAELPTNTAFVVTGNNIKADIDLARRLLEIRLAPTGEHPERRRFQNPDVVRHVLANRHRWLAAAIAILRNRELPKEMPVSSGFAQWDRIVRYPLMSAGLADPAIKFDMTREKSPDIERLTVWMMGLLHGIGVGQPFRASSLVHTENSVDLILNCPTGMDGNKWSEMYKQYLNEYPPHKGWRSVMSIGSTLSRLIDREIIGHKLTSKMLNGSRTYTIERV